MLDCMTMPLPDGATMLTFQDITDTENVERALRERNEALEAADQMKVDFVHHVSYELRSPLTTIIGFAHFLSDPVDRPADGKAGRVSRLHHQIDQRAAGAHQQHPRSRHHRCRRDEARARPGRYRKAIEAAAEGIQDRLATDRIELKVDIDPNIGNFTGDERRVVQVLYNLLANAVGFSPHDAAVTHQRPADRASRRSSP